MIKKIPQSQLPESVKTIEFKHLIPVNYYRSIFHVANGLLAVTCYQFFMTFQQAITLLGSLLALFTFLEITRRMSKRWNDFLVSRVFGLIVRPREHHKINGATFYLLALTLNVFFFAKNPVILAILVLGFGDPFANIIGKKFGKTPLYKEKSLEGSLAFVLISFIVTTTFSLVFQNLDWPLVRLLSLTITLSITGAIIELFSTRLDDNFTILTGCSIIASLWFF